MKTAQFIRPALLGVSLFFTACGGGSNASAVALPEAPDAAVETIMRELGKGNAGVVWQALPESYQSDITGIVREAGDVVDAELYDRGFGLVGRLAEVADKQRDFIFNSQFTQGMDIAEAKANWSPVVKLLRLVAGSEISTASGLRSLDLAAFLDGTGSEMLELVEEFSDIAGNMSLLTQLKGFTAELVEADETSTTLLLKVPGEPEEQETFTQVEGKWVPLEMADAWSSSMEQARAQLKLAAEGSGAQNKPQILGALAMVEGILGQLEAAETQEQFDQTLQGAMIPMMGLMMMGSQLGGGGADAPDLPASPPVQ